MPARRRLESRTSYSRSNPVPTRLLDAMEQNGSSLCDRASRCRTHLCRRGVESPACDGFVFVLNTRVAIWGPLAVSRR